MCQPRTFYVLGAGASFGLIPVTSELPSHVARQYDNIGIYPVSRTVYSSLFDRVMGVLPVQPEDVRGLFRQNIAQGTLDMLVQRGLWRPISHIVPPQYAVFDVVGRPSTLFSFNLDGLAFAYCGGVHSVLEPHGTIDREWMEATDYEELLEATSEFDLALPTIRRKHLLGPEPLGITEYAEYLQARDLFIRSRALIFIGYSFGKWQGRIDDADSLEYFVDLLQLHPVSVIVIDPYPSELVEKLQGRLHSRRVYGLSARWEVLAAVVLSAAQRTGALHLVLRDEQIKDLRDNYCRMNTGPE